MSCLPSTRSAIAGDKHTQLNWLAWARADINWRCSAPESPCGASRGSYQPISETSSSRAAGSVGLSRCCWEFLVWFLWPLGWARAVSTRQLVIPAVTPRGKGTCGCHLSVGGRGHGARGTPWIPPRTGCCSWREVVGAPADAWVPFPPAQLLRQLG